MLLDGRLCPSPACLAPPNHLYICITAYVFVRMVLDHFNCFNILLRSSLLKPYPRWLKRYRYAFINSKEIFFIVNFIQTCWWEFHNWWWRHCDGSVYQRKADSIGDRRSKRSLCASGRNISSDQEWSWGSAEIEPSGFTSGRRLAQRQQRESGLNLPLALRPISWTYDDLTGFDAPLSQMEIKQADQCHETHPRNRWNPRCSRKS